MEDDTSGANAAELLVADRAVDNLVGLVLLSKEVTIYGPAKSDHQL